MACLKCLYKGCVLLVGFSFVLGVINGGELELVSPKMVCGIRESALAGLVTKTIPDPEEVKHHNHGPCPWL